MKWAGKYSLEKNQVTEKNLPAQTLITTIPGQLKRFKVA
jgi:hypothetical protein